MIFWIIVPILIVLIILAKRYSRVFPDPDMFTFFLVIAIGLLVPLTICCTASVLAGKTHLPRVAKDLIIAEASYAEVEKIVLDNMAKYPMESKMFESMDPAFLLKLPEIKSDAFLQNQITKLEAWKILIRDFKFERTSIEQRLDFHSHRWFSLTLATP